MSSNIPVDHPEEGILETMKSLDHFLIRNIADYIFLPTFNLVLVGDGGIGKGEFLQRNGATGKRTTKHPKYKWVDIHTMDFYTNRGPIRFNVGVTGGCFSFSLLRNDVFKGNDGAILMFDVTSRITYKNVPNYHRDIKRVCGNIPVVLCGNKVDIRDRKVKAKQVLPFCRKKNIQYYNVSTNANYNVYEPFLWLARQLSGDKELRFVEFPALQPPEFTFSESIKRQYKAEIEQALAQPLPENDEDDL